MTRTEAPHASGRTPIYNFDAWTEAHYGTSFARRQKAQDKYRERERNESAQSNGMKSEILVFGVLSGFISLLFIGLQLDKATLDSPSDTTGKTKK